MTDKRIHATVRGEVQMVGFRYFVVRQAEALGLAGWVHNGADGRTVEVVAEGAEDRLRQLVAALHEGPRRAVVDAVDADWADTLEGHQGFEVRW
jgi:acylphosphatase